MREAGVEGPTCGSTGHCCAAGGGGIGCAPQLRRVPSGGGRVPPGGGRVTPGGSRVPTGGGRVSPGDAACQSISQSVIHILTILMLFIHGVLAKGKVRLQPCGMSDCFNPTQG